jgi:hypothetical protein
MTGLLPFAGYFFLVSAVTSLVQALLLHESPRQVIREAVQFFLLVVGGIVGLSVVVYLLEWAFIRRP